jgi:uncharacterized protein (TIGR03437 family)
MVTLAPAAPQSFATPNGRVIAQHADYSLITADSPAIAGETIIVYAACLGPTEPNPAPGEIPEYPAQTAGSLTVSLDRSAHEQEWINQVAGVTPGTAGCVPDVTFEPWAATPEIRVTMADQASLEGVILPAQPSPDQAR